MLHIFLFAFNVFVFSFFFKFKICLGMNFFGFVLLEFAQLLGSVGLHLLPDLGGF